MSVFDDPSGRLHWLEDELMEEELEEEYEEEEPEEDFRPRLRFGKPSRAAVYADEREIGDRDAVFVEKKKRRKSQARGLKFLALLEFLGILAVLWWWIKWLY